MRARFSGAGSRRAGADRAASDPRGGRATAPGGPRRSGRAGRAAPAPNPRERRPRASTGPPGSAGSRTGGDFRHGFEVADRLPARIEHDAVDACASRAPRPSAGPRSSCAWIVLGPRAPPGAAPARPDRGPITSSSRTRRSRAARRAVEGFLERFARLDRLLEDSDGAHREGARGVFFRRDDVDRNVPRAEVVLQALEHPPAVDDRQLDVQRDGVDASPGLDERQRVRSLRGDQRLESVLMREVEQETGEVLVVLDDQQRRGRRGRSAPGRRARSVRLEGRLGRMATASTSDMTDTIRDWDSAIARTDCGTGGVDLREVERERAALAGSARQAGSRRRAAARSRG